MQPYIFPYIGYFQLINAVDKFVFYDDVNYIKQGWINRNKILVSNKDYLFTIPLKNASPFSLISEIYISRDLFSKWKSKFLQSLNQSYKKASNFENTINLIESVFQKEYVTISQLSIESIKTISEFIGIKTEFVISSETYQNKELGRQERLIDICRQEKANHYINAIGGQELYKKEDFLKEQIRLDFIKTLPIEYKQFNNEFVPWLSIIDVLMFNEKNKITEFLNQYTLE